MYYDRDKYQNHLKITLCKYWAKNGSCRLGKRCGFAHGEEELGSGITPYLEPRAPAPCAPKIPSTALPRDTGNEWLSYQRDDGSWTWKRRTN